MAATTLVMRHGFSEANRQGLIVSNPAIGCHDYGLTDDGREQVRASLATVPALSAAPVIVCSDFLRTRQTAEICRAFFDADPVRTDSRLRERFFGRWDGGPIAAYRHAWTADQDGSAPTDGVESVAAVLHRMQQALAMGRQQAGSRPLLLISHGDPLNILLTALAGVPPSHHRSHIRLEPGQWRSLPQP